MKKLLLSLVTICGLVPQLQAVENEMFSLAGEIRAFIQNPEIKAEDIFSLNGQKKIIVQGSHVKKLWAGKEKEALITYLLVANLDEECVEEADEDSLLNQMNWAVNRLKFIVLKNFVFLVAQELGIEEGFVDLLKGMNYESEQGSFFFEKRSAEIDNLTLLCNQCIRSKNLERKRKELAPGLMARSVSQTVNILLKQIDNETK